jgi:predicted glutamine amidotransferase
MLPELLFTTAVLKSESIPVWDDLMVEADSEKNIISDIIMIYVRSYTHS